MLRIFLLSFLTMSPSMSYAAEVITDDLVLELLAKEKSFLQTKDISGFSSLLTDSFISTYSDATVGKEQTLNKVAEILIKADKILIKPELTSITVSPDGKSAEISLRTVEKYLFVRGSNQAVSSYVNYSQAVVVLENGKLKYMSSRLIKSE